jgi:hypothetical protein
MELIRKEVTTALDSFAHLMVSGIGMPSGLFIKGM